MRHLLISTALMLAATPLLAAEIEATAPVRKATLYPWGASVTRVIELTAPAGSHEVVIPGLGESTDPASLRVVAEGAKIGAISVQLQRATPGEQARSPDYLAAETEVQRLERALASREADVAAIRARSKAAEDTIQFMLALAESDGFQTGDLAATMQTVGAQMLLARENAIAAETEALAAEQGLDRDRETLAHARARLEALGQSAPGDRALVLAVETTAAPARIEITGFSPEASWQPVYDLRLDRKAGKLTLDRGLMVAQATGEDWRGVTLTLSTARPSEQTRPSMLTPWFPRLSDPAELRRMRSAAPAAAPMAESAADAAGFAGVNVEPIVVEAAEPRMMGATVVYDYPAPVDMRSNVDALRLKLDSRDLTPEIRAVAVPQRDDSAYLTAETVNTLNEVILPGQATLYADEVLVGNQALDLIPAGEKLDLGFGPIDGLVAEYEVPERAEGDRGLISRSNTSSEKALLRVRNLTGEEWMLRVIGQVPVATQDDLKISWSAKPSPTTENPEGQRGLLYWDAPIAPEGVQEITLTTDMSWPEGKTVSETSLYRR